MYKSQDKPNISQLARQFGVPYERLRSRVKGRKSLFQRTPTSRRLNGTQEAALCRYLDHRDTIGKPLKQSEVRDVATKILRQENASVLPLGPDWVKRFLDRHPEYRKRRRRAIDIERLQALDKEVAQVWFEKLQEMINLHGIEASDIYNFGETGFMIGVGKDQWIITREPQRKIVDGTISNREMVTVVEAVSTDCFTVPPVIILKAKSLLYRWFDVLQGDEHLAVTENAYINDALAFQWIQHFERHTRKRTKGKYRMLICDRHGSHFSYEFIHFCEQRNIVLYFLPPHSSHILQPLDVGVFGVFKHWHSEAIEAATATGYQKITKDIFLAGIDAIRQKTFKRNTVARGFKLTGIYPFNPDIVCDLLPDSVAHHRYHTPSDSAESNPYKTPNTLQRFQKLEHYLTKEKNLQADRLLEGIKKLSKGAQSVLYDLEQFRDECESFQATITIRDANRRASKEGMKTNGIISSAWMARMKQNKQDGENLVDLDNALKQWKKKQKKVMVEMRRYVRVRSLKRA